jgi:hypothetical protein
MELLARLCGAGWRAPGLDGIGPARRNQETGAWCGGRFIEECSALFGESLSRVCTTCPE